MVFCEIFQYQIFCIIYFVQIIINLMISTFEREEEGERASYISYIENSDFNQQKLTSFHQIIFQKENEVDAEALQQYLNSVRTNKIGKERVFTEKTQITYIISNVFTLLKRMLIIPQNQQHFSKIVSVYIEMVKCRENSRHHLGLLQQHLKQILNLDLHRKNKKLYIFISKIFEVSPYIVYKILQAKPDPIEWNSPQSLKIYAKFIQFAASKKNNLLLTKQIKNCINRKNCQQDDHMVSTTEIIIHKLDRLKILLANFPRSLLHQNITSNSSPLLDHNRYTIIDNSPPQTFNDLPDRAIQSHQTSPLIIIEIYEYINHLIEDQLNKRDKDFEASVLEIIQLFIAIPWHNIDLFTQTKNKNQIIIRYLYLWKNKNSDPSTQLLINKILGHLEISQEFMEEIKNQILVKIDHLSVYTDNSQNFRFLKILFSKLGRERLQTLLTQQEIINILLLALTFPLKQQLVSMLDTIKNLDAYQLSQRIRKQLKLKVEEILVFDKHRISQRPQSARGMLEPQFYSNEDRRLALKSLRKFKFDSVEVYTILKQYVLKNHLRSKSFEFRKQVVKTCLYVLTRQSEFIDKNRIMREILNLINKDMNLKIMTIQWFRDRQDNYEKKIFQIFKEPEFLHILFQDYASNHMLLKRFSIKVLCFIYPLNQCQIVPFLKRAYYHIYDRLSAEKLVTFEEKKQALSLTRQILRHRTQIISDDSATLCNFLYYDLYKCRNYDEEKQNQLLIELFKTIVDIVRKTPKSLSPFIRTISDFIIKLLNSKDEDEKVKNYALNALNQLVRNCNYVLLPYFHFHNLYELLRQILKQGNRDIDYCQLLRLLGNLGFLNKDKFDRIRKNSSNKQDYKMINQQFQKVYRETNYLKCIRSLQEAKPITTTWNGPFLFTKQETSYTYIEIETFKSYIFAKIAKIISERPSKIVSFMVYKVLEAFIPILRKQDQKAYQQIILYEILHPNNLQISSTNVFSLMSKIIRYQDTKQHHQIIINYFLKLCQNSQNCRQYQLMQLLYIITSEYPQQAFNDKQLRKIIFFITDRLSKDSATSYDIKLGLNIVQNLADYIDNLIHLFLPQFNKLFLKEDQNICLPYFQMILTLCRKAQSTEFYLPPISQSLLELLKRQSEKYKNNQTQNSMFIQKIINFALCLIIIYGNRFKSFVINFRHLVSQININHILYKIAEQYMKKNSSLNYIQSTFTSNEINEIFKHTTLPDLKKQANQNQSQFIGLLKKTIFTIIQQFNCDKNQIEDQSEEWFNKICIVLFEKSPNRFIHQCLPLVKQDRSFSHDIFPLAFYFFWGTLNEDEKKKLVNKLKFILQSKVISLRIKQKFIDTIYFMAQWKSPIPLKNKFLCDVCTDILDLAKALFYMENLFENDPETYGESLIKTYCELGEKQSALGLLKVVSNLNTKTKILLYQKLKRYHWALKQYDLLADPLKPENMLIQITIRKQMSDWDSVIKLCQTQSMKNPTFKNNLAPLATEAAVNLGKWDQVRHWLDCIQDNEQGDERPENRTQRTTYQNFNIWKTMLMIHQRHYQDAQKYIYQARKAIYPKICQLFNFSFERSMQGVIRLQQLSELEETVDYFKYQAHYVEEDEKKKKFLTAQYRKRLQSLWNDRIEGSKRNLNAMQQLLMTRNLLLTKVEDFSNWLDFCHLALRQNQPQFSKKTLTILAKQLENDNDIKKKFDIETSMIEAKFILGQIKDQEAVSEIEEIIKDKGSSKSDRSVCKLYENCALWLSEKQYDFNIAKGNKCIEMLEKTTKKIKKHVKGWHLMGLMHLKMYELLEEKNKISRKRLNQQQDMNCSFVRQNRQSHIFQGLHCFIKSVSCGIKNHGFFLEDCLKILNIVFNESQVIGLVDQLNKYYVDIPTEGLIDVIPQIISRLDVVDKPKLFQMMKKLLVHIGSHHPHAIIFPIVFLRKGNNENRKKIAEDIYKQILKKDSKVAEIFADTEKIVTQLCKVSLKLNEKFKIIVLKLYEQSKTADPKVMASKYINICNKFIKECVGDLSLSQFGFLQQYRQQLSDIINALQIYLAYHELQFFRKAQRIILRLLQDLTNSLKSIKKISLNQASPVLRKIQNTNVCLPGTYAPNSQNIYISSFKPQLDVIDSKQRPKKLIVIGSDGKEHLFLLKGKQDLRLDQRIMQLFNLINKMFHDPAERQLYSIKGYSITPISPQTGLIRWVQNCDTIGNLIEDYRASTLSPSKKYLQLQLSKSMSIKQYFKLPKPNKVQLYKEIETKVSGWDLRNIFWIRSINSEEWLKSRSMYVRSLAVMSMVGYIIGLGDRHPHNIMVQRNTGKIVHIDFGDCFDVNRMRKQFPEKVPFRLTRMLVKAMQPCGTHGIFKHTCQKIIKMLRSNKQSILTIIEAFRYDPIISWKFKIREEDQDTSFYQNNPTDQSCYIEEDKQRQQMDSKNKINLYGNRLNFQFAQHVLNQVKKKLGGKTGNDTNKVMSPVDQVDALIAQAISPENLVEHFEGWLIYW